MVSISILHFIRNPLYSIYTTLFGKYLGIDRGILITIHSIYTQYTDQNRHLVLDMLSVNIH